jgi:hypothetical protein
MELPNPVLFTGVRVQRVHVTHYRSGFNVETLLESAREELATAKPEQFKIFLLGACAGLRRNEIDKLPWSAFRFDEGVIHIAATEHFRPKSREAEGDLIPNSWKSSEATTRGGKESSSSSPTARRTMANLMSTIAASAISWS